MGRKYVRDKAGRFAPKGGGSKGKGGKMGKSAKNLKARASYKKASGKLREQKKFDKQMKAGSKSSQKYWKKQLGGAKSGMTRVTNRLTNKRAAKARTGANKPGKLVPNANKLAASKTYAAARKAKKGSSTRKIGVLSAKIRRGERRAKAEIRKGAKARASYKPKQEAKQARERILKKTKAKRMAAGGMKTPKGKLSKTKPNAAKEKYKKAKSNLRGAVRTQKKGLETLRKANTSKVTAANLKERKAAGKAAESNKKKVSSAKASLTRLTKKNTKGATIGKKPPRTAKGKMAYDGANKSASEARDRLIAKTKAIRDKKATTNVGTSDSGYGQLRPRGVKKRRGAKTYDNTTNTSIKMKALKKNLRRKYPESKAAKSLEKRVAAKAKKPSYKKPKPGETAKQYKARLKRSGTLSTQRALSGNFGTRSEYYSIPGTKTGGKQTRKSINRAKNRDFYSEGSNKRSKAITKSKQRNKAKVKKQLDAIRRKAKNIKFGEKKGPLTSGLSRGSSFFSSKWK